MAKRRFTITAVLPGYTAPSNEWRRRVHSAVLDAQTSRGVGYRESDRLELRIALFLGQRPLDIHEIDERVKDILDALGGRIAGPRSRRRIAPISLPPSSSTSTGSPANRRARSGTSACVTLPRASASLP